MRRPVVVPPSAIPALRVGPPGRALVRSVLCMRAGRTMSPKQLLPLGLLLSGASVSALRQPIGRITSLNRNRLVADEEDSVFYRAPRLVNHADGESRNPSASPPADLRPDPDPAPGLTRPEQMRGWRS